KKVEHDLPRFRVCDVRGGRDVPPPARWGTAARSRLPAEGAGSLRRRSPALLDDLADLRGFLVLVVRGAEVLLDGFLPRTVGDHLLQRLVDLVHGLGVALLDPDAVVLVAELQAGQLDLAHVLLLSGVTGA